VSGRRAATISKMPNPNISNAIPIGRASLGPVTGNVPATIDVGAAWATTDVTGPPLALIVVVVTAPEATDVDTSTVVGVLATVVVATAVVSVPGVLVVDGIVVSGGGVVTVVAVDAGEVSGGVESSEHTPMVRVPVSKLQPFAPAGSSHAATLTRQVCAAVRSPNENEALVAAPNVVEARSAPSIQTRKVFTPSPLNPNSEICRPASQSALIGAVCADAEAVQIPTPSNTAATALQIIFVVDRVCLMDATPRSVPAGFWS
jgi:hypothetical protein